MPKSDANAHPYYVELTGIHLEGVELKGINFANVTMWDTRFIGVNMTRSSFADTDLGGTIFGPETSVEWSDFTGAFLNQSFMANPPTPTTFDRARLYGAKLQGARADCCRVRDIDIKPEQLKEQWPKCNLYVA